MKSNVVAVINDHTGEFMYVLFGYESEFPKALFRADKIERAGQFGEDYIATRGEYSQYLNSAHYSAITHEVKEIMEGEE